MEDLISREEVIEILKNAYAKNFDYMAVIDMIEELPSKSENEEKSISVNNGCGFDEFSHSEYAIYLNG